MDGKLSLEKVRWALRLCIHGQHAYGIFNNKTGLFGGDKRFWQMIWKGE